MKIRMWTVVLLTTIRKARNHSQEVDHCRDEDHCQYHFGIDHCQTGNAARIKNTVRMDIHHCVVFDHATCMQLVKCGTHPSAKLACWAMTIQEMDL